ncbi:hypothetical protein PCANC_21179 [Puccinia coronata f. sp. avenae]|uniref:Uncharacterized protein n=1 Tax=Puccinia coronata f. sp. avenae TaxID=200324 RepID=A0A2N5SEX1_9BASI|nr:hypothetical protein PCANC_21179 [Puccinia coronata f. sp. avenae]
MRRRDSNPAGWNWRVIEVGQCEAWPTQHGHLAPRTLQPPAALRQLNMIGQTRLNGQHALWLDSACPRSLVEHGCLSIS